MTRATDNVHMTCLGCFATREPGEPLTDCDCELGLLSTPERGIINYDDAFTWVPTSEVEGPRVIPVTEVDADRPES